MDLKEAKAISSLFQAVHTSASVRLARGARERKRIFEALQQGTGQCTSYRLDWLKSASDELVGQLAHVAQKFNENHQFDQCSVQDLVDILEMAAGKLRRD